MPENNEPTYSLKKDADLINLVSDFRTAFHDAPCFYEALHFKYKHVITPEDQNYSNVLKSFQQLRRADLTQMLNRNIVLILSAGKSEFENSAAHINLTNSEFTIVSANGGGGIEPEKIREAMVNYLIKKSNVEKMHDPVPEIGD